MLLNNRQACNCNDGFRLGLRAWVVKLTRTRAALPPARLLRRLQQTAWARTRIHKPTMTPVTHILPGKFVKSAILPVALCSAEALVGRPIGAFASNAAVLRFENEQRTCPHTTASVKGCRKTTGAPKRAFPSMHRVSGRCGVQICSAMWSDLRKLSRAWPFHVHGEWLSATLMRVSNLASHRLRNFFVPAGSHFDCETAAAP